MEWQAYKQEMHDEFVLRNISMFKALNTLPFGTKQVHHSLH
jgi:hypothetical protein